VKEATVGEDLRELFLLDPEVHFLNHGSFGACPKPVFAEYQRWQLEMERQPVHFVQHRLHPELLKARAALGAFINAPAENLVFVDNATWGVNVIARSFDFKPGDELLTTDHEYGACDMTWEWQLRKQGAAVVRQPIPLPVTTHADFVDAFWAGVTPKTKVIYLSHITSPTALIFPIEEICRRAREAGILTVIDGAHAPGQLKLDMQKIGADIYTGNLHKWLCTPKGTGFLYVRPEHQAWVESLVISWGWGRKNGIDPDSTFVERNEWQGTRDHSAFLAVPAAIEFRKEHNWDKVQCECNALLRSTRDRIAELSGLPSICPDSGEWFLQLAACPVRTDDATSLKTRLIDEFKIEIPIVNWHDQIFVRISVQGYNTQADLDALVDALERIC
jgi:isopenicillin-N epimerase